MYTVFILSTVVLVTVDQLLKFAAVHFLGPGGSIAFIPHVLDFYLIYNDGAAFSMLAGKQIFLIIFTGLALIALFAYVMRSSQISRLEYVAYVLIFSGGIGNLIDRCLNQKVVDYIRVLFFDFPIFNFADICVCTGVGLFLIAQIWDEFRKKSTSEKDENNSPDSH